MRLCWRSSSRSRRRKASELNRQAARAAQSAPGKLLSSALEARPRRLQTTTALHQAQPPRSRQRSKCAGTALLMLRLARSWASRGRCCIVAGTWLLLIHTLHMLRWIAGPSFIFMIIMIWLWGAWVM